MVQKSKGLKIVQSMCSTSVIIRHNGALKVIRFLQLCPLAVVESTAAPVLKEVQHSMSASTALARACHRQSRIATTDSFSGNLACEQGIAAERGPASQSDNLHQFCDVHKLQTCHEKEMSLVPSDISGMINAALTLMSGSNMENLGAV